MSEDKNEKKANSKSGEPKSSDSKGPIPKSPKKSKEAAVSSSQGPAEIAKVVSQLAAKYKKEVIPALLAEFKYSTPMQVPRLLKIVLNCGVGEATGNVKTIDYAVYGLTQISGQKPLINRSKKAIAVFKLRENLPIGVSVTMRQARMWHFLERLISVALPRVRDFRGVPTRGFDGRGNYTMGLHEQIAFPEVVMEKLDKVRGMDITFVTSARTDDEGRSLLKHLGLPFKKAELAKSDDMAKAA